MGGGDNRLSDGSALYSVSRGSDGDDDGSVVMSAGGGGVLEEENERSASKIDSGRSREESRLKTVAAMKS